jgi:hypothetical protein
LIELDTRHLENENRRYEFLGGDFAVINPTPYLHELGLGLYERNNQTFLVARIRLFAYLGSPVFYVVVGTVSASRLTSVVVRLSQNNSRTHAP